MFRPALCAAICLTSACASTHAGSIDPRGVYFHHYTGPFSGFEWIQIVDQPGDNRYEFSDLRGAVPYRGEILPDGTTTWDTTSFTSGSGAFASADRATFTLGFQGSTFTSNIWRAPFTGTDFITSIESRESGSAVLAGAWNVAVQSIDPQTGEITDESADTIGVTVAGDTMRLTMSSGIYYQGVFESQDRVGFRVHRQVVPPSFQTYAGSEFSENLNLLGDLRITGENAFEAILLTERRGTGGNLQPRQLRLIATRVPTPGTAAVIVIALAVPRRGRR